LEVDNDPLSIQQLAKDSGLPSEIVKKHIRLMEAAKESRLMEAAKESPGFRVIASPRKVIPEPVGFLSLPEKKRVSYLRMNYPLVGEEGLMMLELYKKGASSNKNGIGMARTKILDELVDAEQVKEVKGKFFLTELGKRVTKGMLKIYPELS